MVSEVKVTNIVHFTVGFSHIQYNRSFSSFSLPLFRNESKCKTFLMEVILIYMKMNLKAEVIFI